MAHHDERLRDIEDRFQYEDPDFANAMAQGVPVPAAEPVRPRLALAHRGLSALGIGIAVGHGLLIAAGLVAAGAAGQLFDPDRRGRGRGRQLPRRR
ncbi:DUF3040 domain-containing protein [Streptomyces sp. M10(2022)]